MAEKQGIPNDTAPPPYPPNNEGYQSNPGYGVNPNQPGYPPQGPPGYPQQAPPGYNPQAPPAYNPQAPPAYNQQAPPGYPPQQGYPPQDKAGYPQQVQPGYGYPQQPMPVGMATHNVTVVQTGGPTVVAAVYPSDYCGLAWFSCLCCFWPLGICAIINSNNARDAMNRGDLASAAAFSQMARKYAYWSIGCGAILIILIIVLRVILYSAYMAN